MADQLLINIGIFETLAIIVAASGSLISLAWYASGRFTRMETLIEGFDKRLTSIEGHALGVFTQKSPIALTPKGLEMLMQSGLKDFIDDSRDELIRMFGSDLGEEDVDTSYDIQELAFEFFDEIEFDAPFSKHLKEYAFSAGTSMEVLRRTAGIYFRDILLSIRAGKEK